jgi:hypothetical protein
VGAPNAEWNRETAHFGRARCRVCEEWLDVHQQVRGGVCGSPDCRRTDVVRSMAARREEQQRALRARATRRMKRVAHQLGADPERRYALAIVPTHEGALAPVLEERRGAFRTHLVKIVSEVFAEAPEGVSDADLEPDPIHEREETLLMVCATCRGNCCEAGGNHAYLDTRAIRRYASWHPDATQAEIVAAYTARVPEQSVTASCILHGERGCSLPREMHGHTCNRFVCPGAEAVGPALEKADGRLVFAASAREDGTLVRFAAFEGETFEHFETLAGGGGGGGGERRPG